VFKVSSAVNHDVQRRGDHQQLFELHRHILDRVVSLRQVSFGINVGRGPKSDAAQAIAGAQTMQSPKVTVPGNGIGQCTDILGVTCTDYSHRSPITHLVLSKTTETNESAVGQSFFFQGKLLFRTDQKKSLLAHLHGGVGQVLVDETINGQ
jgi:hypothetical protein